MRAALEHVLVGPVFLCEREAGPSKVMDAARPQPEREQVLLRPDDPASLVYIGEGIIGSRVAAHAAKMRDPDNEQGQVFARSKRLEFSYVVNDTWLDHQFLEVENDLIAAHILTTGRVPDAQFIG